MSPWIGTDAARRAFAFLAIFGGCVVFTGFAAVSLWLLRAHPGFVFWLALAAHVQILVGMTALGWQMGRRLHLEGTRDGVTISDKGDDDDAPLS